VGTNCGVWLGSYGSGDAAQKRIAVLNVRKLAVLTDHSLLLVLAGQSLYAFELEYFANINASEEDFASPVVTTVPMSDGVYDFAVFPVRSTSDPRMPDSNIVLHTRDITKPGSERFYMVRPYTRSERAQRRLEWGQLQRLNGMDGMGSVFWTVHGSPYFLCVSDLRRLTMFSTLELKDYGLSVVLRDEDLSGDGYVKSLLGVFRASAAKLLVVFRNAGIYISTRDGQPVQEMIRWESPSVNRAAVLAGRLLLVSQMAIEVRDLAKGVQTAMVTGDGPYSLTWE